MSRLRAALGSSLFFVLDYGALVGAVVFAFVRLYEEPALTRRFDASYEAYLREVPGWWPRRPAA